jgi:hypothetical protein
MERARATAAAIHDAILALVQVGEARPQSLPEEGEEGGEERGGTEVHGWSVETSQSVDTILPGPTSSGRLQRSGNETGSFRDNRNAGGLLRLETPRSFVVSERLVAIAGASLRTVVPNRRDVVRGGRCAECAEAETRGAGFRYIPVSCDIAASSGFLLHGSRDGIIDGRVCTP